MVKKHRLPVIFLMLLLMVCGVAPAIAADSSDDELVTLTLDQAISRAVRYSDNLAKTKLSTDTAEDNLTDAQLNWNSAWVTDYVPGTEQYYQALLNARYNYDAALKNEEIQKDSIAATTRSKYYNVLQSVKSLEQKKKELEIAERQEFIAQSKYSVGFISWSEWRQTDLSLTEAQSAVVKAENDLETVYRSFDRQVGLDISIRPVLTDEPAFEEMQIDNPGAVIRSIVSDSPETWVTSENLELKERLLDYPGSTDQDEISLEQAKINADIQKTNSIDSLYDIYYSIISLEKSYQSTLVSLELAEKELKNTELKVSVGLASSSDLMNAQLSLLKQQNSLFSIVCQHELLKIEFEQPWAS